MPVSYVPNRQQQEIRCVGTRSPQLTYEGRAKERDIKGYVLLLGQALHPWQLREGRNSREYRIRGD